MKAKGGLPTFVNLQPALGAIAPAWHHVSHWNKLHECQNGDVVHDEHVLLDLDAVLADKLFYSSVSVYKMGKGFPNRNSRMWFEPDLSNPFKVIVSLESNIDCTFFITERIMDCRRFWHGQPFFVNGYHKFCLERPIMSDAIVLVFDCDEKLRRLVEDVE